MGRTLKHTPLSDSIYQVAYGTGETLRKLDGDFSCHVPSYARPNFQSENEDYIFLSSGCGTGCRIGHLLPLDTREKIKLVPLWLASDLSKNIVISLDHRFKEQTVIIKVLQTNTGEELVFRPDISCDYAVGTDCIKSVAIQDNQIKVIWEKGLNSKPYIITLKD